MGCRCKDKRDCSSDIAKIEDIKDILTRISVKNIFVSKELENLAHTKFDKNAMSRSKEFFLLTKEEVLQFILSIKNDDMEVWQDEQLLPNNKVAA